MKAPSTVNTAEKSPVFYWGAFFLFALGYLFLWVPLVELIVRATATTQTPGHLYLLGSLFAGVICVMGFAALVQRWGGFDDFYIIPSLVLLALLGTLTNSSRVWQSEELYALRVFQSAQTNISNSQAILGKPPAFTHKVEGVVDYDDLLLSYDDLTDEAWASTDPVRVAWAMGVISSKNDTSEHSRFVLENGMLRDIDELYFSQLSFQKP